MVWGKIKASLKNTLAENVFNLWIDPIEFVRMQNECIYLSSPDRYFSAYVKQNYLGIIEKELNDSGLEDVKVVFTEEKRIPPAEPAAPKKKVRAQLRLPTIPQNTSKFRSLHPRYTFDEFMVGESNILAESACKSMIGSDGVFGPCLYINSETGLGKSHLTHAVAHKVLKESPMTRLHYLTAKQFSAEMVRGIQTNSMGDFKRKYQENCDILLVEDIHSLTGKKKTQEELNDVLDTLIKSGKKVIVTSKSAPRDLVGIDSEFCSRMTSGLVTCIKAPDVATRSRIVEKKAALQQLRLREEQVEFLANHIRGDVRKIESAMMAIRAKARLTGGHIDLDLVKEVVASIVGANQILTPAMIRDLVSAQFKVSVKDLQSKSRKKIITFPRQIAMYLARKHTEESLAEIGRTFNRDHSTVLHAIKVVSDRSVRDTSVGAQVNMLSDKVQQL